MGDTTLEIVLRAVATELQAGLAAAGEAVAAFAAETKAKLVEVEAAGAELGKSFEGFGGILEGLVAAFAAEKIVDGLKDLAVKAAEAKEPMEVAAQVAHNLGHAFDEAKGEEFLEGLATSGKAGTASIGELRAGMQTLAQVTNTQAQAERASQIAAQLAAARHLDYATAVGIVTKVLTGHVALLGRYGFATKDAAGHTLDTKAAMEGLDTATRHAAEVVGKGLPGQLAQLGSRMSLLGESIGDVLVPAMLSLTQLAQRVVDYFRGMSPQMLETIAVIAGVAAAFLAVLATATVAVVAFEAVAAAMAELGVMAAPFFGIVAAVTAVGLAALWLATHWQQAGDIMRAVWAAIVGAVRSAVAFIVGLWEDLGEALSGLGAIFPWFGATVKDVWAAIVDVIRGCVTVVGGLFNDLDTLLGGTGNAFADLSSWISGVCTAIATNVANMVRNVVGWLQNVGTAIVDIMKAAGARVYDSMDASQQAGLRKLGAGLDKFGGALAGAGKAAGTGLVTGVVSAVHAGQSAIAGAGTFVADMFKRHALPAYKDAGKPAFDDPLGENAGKGGAGKSGGRGAESVDDLKTQLDAMRATLAEILSVASDNVDRANANLEAATAKLDAYKASIGGKATTSDEVAHEQALITEQKIKQQAVGAAILEQETKTKEVAAAEGAMAAKLEAARASQLKSTRAAVDAANALAKAHGAAGEAARRVATDSIAAYKTLQEQARLFLDAQRKHTTEAIRLDTTYQRSLATLAAMSAAMLAVRDEYADAQDAVAQAAGKNADAGERGRLDTGEADIRGAQEASRRTEGIEKARGVDKGPVAEDKDALKTAQLNLQLEQLRESVARAIAANDVATAQTVKANAVASGDKDKIAAATEALNLAMTKGASDIAVAAENTRAALTNVAIATAAYTTAVQQSTFNFTNAMITAGKQIAQLVPGLSMQSTGALLFNWQAALTAVLQKTQAYADIQRTVTQLMNLFAQILDKMRPIIDLFLDVITDLANGFVALWNIVAKLLSIIGIQIGDLSNLNSGLVPLIQVVHNIPTLNELGQGKLNSPLSQTPVGLNSVTSKVTAAIASPGLGGGLMSKLLQVAVIIVVFKLIVINNAMRHQQQMTQLQTTQDQSLQVQQQILAKTGTGGGGGLFGGLLGGGGGGLASIIPWVGLAVAAVGIVSALGGSGGSSNSNTAGSSGTAENGGTIVVGDGSGGASTPNLNSLTGNAAAAAAAATAKFIRSTEFATALQTSGVVAATAAVAAAAAAALHKTSSAVASRSAAAVKTLGAASTGGTTATNNLQASTTTTLTIGDVYVRSDADLAALQKQLAQVTINTDRSSRYNIARVTS